MKKKLIIFFIVITLLLLIGLIIYKKDNLRFKVSYEMYNNVEFSKGNTINVDININNNNQYLNKNNIINTLNTKTGIVYFGYNTCPWCRNIVSILTFECKNENVNLYYVDIKSNYNSVKDKLYKKIDNYLKINEDNVKGLAVPLVISIKDGKILDGHIGTVDSYKNPYKGMNAKQRLELRKIYRKMIKEIK